MDPEEIYIYSKPRKNTVTIGTVSKRLGFRKIMLGIIVLILLLLVVDLSICHHLNTRSVEGVSQDAAMTSHPLIQTDKAAGADFDYAQGFGYPVGTGQPLDHCRDGDGYYVARNFLSTLACHEFDLAGGAHLGEDWNGEGGGDTDLGDEILAVANGVVVYSDNPGPCWGKMIIILHVAPSDKVFILPDGQEVKEVWSLYAHEQDVFVSEGDKVSRGERIGTIGADCCDCDAHLHFEIVTDPQGPFPGKGYYSLEGCKDRKCGRVDPTEFISLNNPGVGEL